MEDKPVYQNRIVLDRATEKSPIRSALSLASIVGNWKWW